MTNGDNLSRSALFLFTHLSLDLRDLYSWLSVSILKRSYIITQGTKRLKLYFQPTRHFKISRIATYPVTFCFLLTSQFTLAGRCLMHADHSKKESRNAIEIVTLSCKAPSGFDRCRSFWGCSIKKRCYVNSLRHAF